MKKTIFLSAVAALMLLAASFALIVSFDNDDDAADARGAGTIGADFTGYVPVSTLDDLSRVGKGVAAASDFDGLTYDWLADDSYYLTNNITILSTDSFVPIGTAADPFEGIFDGDEWTITMALNVVTAADNAYAGLFGHTYNAEIRNLYIGEGSIVTADAGPFEDHTGGIVAHAAGTLTMENCHNAGTVTSLAWGYAGGLIGYTDDAEITMTDCSNEGNIISYPYAGGLIGRVQGTASLLDIADCYNEGAVTSSGSNVSYTGGMVGYIYGAISVNIDGCYNGGSVTPSPRGNVGGIIGSATDIGSLTASDCYNLENISGRRAGGLFGDVNNITEIEIKDCYNEGAVSAVTSPVPSDVHYAGGMAGYIGNGGMITVTGFINDGAVEARLGIGGNYAGGIIGRSSNAASVTISDSCNLKNIRSDGFGGGLAGTLSGNYSTVQMNDCYNEGNVTTEGSNSGSAGGLAGLMSGTGIEISIDDCYNEGNVTSGGYDNAGGIAGMISGTDSKTQINDCYNEGNVTSGGDSGDAGGIIGYAGGTGAELEMNGCYNEGAVRSDREHAGGLFGWWAGAEMAMTECRNEGGVTAYANAGGVIGRITGTGDEVRMDSCNNTGTVSGGTYAGGLVGYVAAAGSYLELTGCYNEGNVTTSGSGAPAGGLAGAVSGDSSKTNAYDSYNLGDVTASGAAGGIFGSLYGTGAEADLKDCYNKGNVTSTADSAGGVTGVTNNVSVTMFKIFNEGSVTGAWEAGGLLGWINSSSAVDIMITNCYNIGDAAGNPAGGIAGLLSLSNSAVLIANCYNAGDMTAASKGGILGGASGSATDIAVINCYYLEGVPLCGAGIASLTVDGENAGTYPDNTYDPVRNADQFTGERTPEEMKASLSNALKNKTIYFIGTTDTDTMFGEVAGWDFESGDIWTIISYINDGYPVFKVMYPDDEDDDDDDDTPLWPWIVIVLLGVLFLLIFLDDDEEEVTGRVTHNGNGLSGVTVSYTVDGKSGSVKTNGKGIYVIDVDEGSVISITGVVKSGYSVNEALPLTFTVSKDITEVNFTMQ